MTQFNELLNVGHLTEKGEYYHLVSTINIFMVQSGVKVNYFDVQEVLQCYRWSATLISEVGVLEIHVAIHVLVRLKYYLTGLETSSTK